MTATTRPQRIHVFTVPDRVLYLPPHATTDCANMTLAVVPTDKALPYWKMPYQVGSGYEQSIAMFDIGNNETLIVGYEHPILDRFGVKVYQVSHASEDALRASLPPEIFKKIQHLMEC